MIRRTLATLIVIAAFGVTAGAAAADTAGTGKDPKVQHSDFSFTHHVDKASPVLM